jgi:hypothetical protein
MVLGNPPRVYELDCTSPPDSKNMRWITNNKFQNRVHEIAYGFGDPSEKNVSPH